MTSRFRRTTGLAAVVMVLVGACSASTTPAPASSAPTPTAAASAAAPSSAASAAPSAAASAAPAAAVPAVPTGFTELDNALGSSQPYKGKTVSIQVQWTQGELTNFQNSLADFQKATGITIQVDSVPTSHETVLKARIEGGAPPDIAQLAQPTGILAYGAEGKVIDLATVHGPQPSSRRTTRRRSACTPRVPTSGRSRTRPTSSRRSGIRSRRSPPRATRFRRRGPT